MEDEDQHTTYLPLSLQILRAQNNASSTGSGAGCQPGQPRAQQPVGFWVQIPAALSASERQKRGLILIHTSSSFGWDGKPGNISSRVCCRPRQEVRAPGSPRGALEIIPTSSAGKRQSKDWGSQAPLSYSFGVWCSCTFGTDLPNKAQCLRNAFLCGVRVITVVVQGTWVY